MYSLFYIQCVHLRTPKEEDWLLMFKCWLCWKKSSYKSLFFLPFFLFFETKKTRIKCIAINHKRPQGPKKKSKETLLNAVGGSTKPHRGWSYILSMKTWANFGCSFVSHDCNIWPVKEEGVVGSHRIKVSKDIIINDLPLWVFKNFFPKQWLG